MKPQKTQRAQIFFRGFNKSLCVLCALCGFLTRSAWARLEAPDIGLLQEQNRIKRESEEKIQKDVLDPILGKGKAMAFVDVEMELKIQRTESTRSGMGLAEKYREKLAGLGDRSAGSQTTYVLPGIPKPKTISEGASAAPEKPESLRAQQSQQIKGIEEVVFSYVPEFKRLLVTIIHDDTVCKTDERRKMVAERIVDAMGQYKLTLDQVVFRPTRFDRPATIASGFKEDLKRPEVYLPLIFASLLLLFLMWLFGPLRRFMRNYVAALREKPGAEVNIESETKLEGAGDKEGGGPLGEQEKLDITYQAKPPWESEEEDDAMKKFEPFSYVNEENIKRLAYMFLLRKEEPWVIATVVTYLRPDYARQVLVNLPLELQAKVAIEALTVRQVTREQVVAIDNEVRESIDFVLGGIEKLTAMLDEADSATRGNILSYLKNEKPSLYEKVRRYILSFEDIANFPDRDMQVIVRELKTENMAKALCNASPDVANKVFSNMSAGAAALLKEFMEYTSNLTPDQVEMERGKIMDQIKVLEKQGKVTVRQKPQEAADIAGMQEELSEQIRRQQRFSAARKREAALEASPPRAPAATPALSALPAKAGAPQQPAADPAQAQQYLAAGVSQYNAGQMEAAVQYFQYALTLDAGLWQAHQYLGNCLYQTGRTREALAHYERLLEMNPDPQLQAWVENFKAQVS